MQAANYISFHMCNRLILGAKTQLTQYKSIAFCMLKQHLCSAQVFSYPQLHKEFVLQTDDSDCGLGAVLAQKDSQGNEHVVTIF